MVFFKVADWLMKGGVGDDEDDVDIDSETGDDSIFISPGIFIHIWS